MPHVIMTPHVSDYSNRYRDNQFLLYRENLRRYVAGDRMLMSLTFSVGTEALQASFITAGRVSPSGTGIGIWEPPLVIHRRDRREHRDKHEVVGYHDSLCDLCVLCGR